MMLPCGMIAPASAPIVVSHAGEREYRSQRGEHLRKDPRPADPVHQPASLFDGCRCGRPQPRVTNDQREDDAEAEEHQGHRFRVDHPGALERRISKGERPDERRERDDQGGKEKPVAMAVRTPLSLFWVVNSFVPRPSR